MLSRRKRAFRADGRPCLGLGIALIFDAVTDPLAGVLSDRTESRWGRRHPFRYASALPLAICFYFAFAPPAGLGQTALFGRLLLFRRPGRARTHSTRAPLV
jgi:hypothetical protein